MGAGAASFADVATESQVKTLWAGLGTDARFSFGEPCVIQLNFSSRRIDNDLLIEGLAIVGLAMIGALIPDDQTEPEDLEPDADESNAEDGGPST